MQVAKWGNSLAVRLPLALVQELGIAVGPAVLDTILPGTTQACALAGSCKTAGSNGVRLSTLRSIGSK